MNKKTYGVSTLMKTLRYGSLQAVLSGSLQGDWQIGHLREVLTDIDYVRDQIIKRIEELEAERAGPEEYVMKFTPTDY